MSRLPEPTPPAPDRDRPCLGLLRRGRRRQRVHRPLIQLCGPADANAVDAEIKLCKTTGRADIVTRRGGFHGSTHRTMSVRRLVSSKERVANIMAGVHCFPLSYEYRWHRTLSPET